MCGKIVNLSMLVINFVEIVKMSLILTVRYCTVCKVYGLIGQT